MIQKYKCIAFKKVNSFVIFFFSFLYFNAIFSTVDNNGHNITKNYNVIFFFFFWERFSNLYSQHNWRTYFHNNNKLFTNDVIAFTFSAVFSNFLTLLYLILLFLELSLSTVTVLRDFTAGLRRNPLFLFFYWSYTKIDTLKNPKCLI